jgi:hypothetical protein
VVVRFVDIGGIVDNRCLSIKRTTTSKESLNSHCQQFHQYQQNEQPPLKKV